MLALYTGVKEFLWEYSKNQIVLSMQIYQKYTAVDLLATGLDLKTSVQGKTLIGVRI